MLITHNLLSLESILKMSSADLASILGIDQHVGEIISAAAKKLQTDVIAPHGCCSGYEPNYGKLHDTRNPGESPDTDTERKKDKVTTADVT